MSLIGTIASADLFPLLRVKAALGRVHTREDDMPGAARVILLSHGLWQRRFGFDPNVVGRELNIDGKNAVVIGVAPADFKFPPDEEKTEYWMPVASDPNIKATARAA